MSINEQMLRLIRGRIDEAEIFLMFGPFPEPYTYLSDKLSRELPILRSLLARARRPPRDLK